MWTLVSLSIVLLLAVVPVGPANAAQQGGPVVVIQVADAISPVTAEYIVESLAAAEELGASLFLLQLDTPGGLDVAMRDVIQAFLSSDVPTCVFVAPPGARAASAGFMIALAADVVVMAPGTNTGAATPVPLGGGGLDETMKAKVVQDAVAYARSIAEQRGRPMDPAGEAVSEGRSFAASEAVELGLADFIAEDVDELLAALTDFTVRAGSDEQSVLALEGAAVVDIEMTTRQRILSTLAHPQIAYFLLLLGAAGIYFELSNPGAVLPGVVGAVSIVLALLALQQLPFTYAGLALMMLAVVFIILEFNVVSYGLLSVAGLISFVLGSLLLFRGPVPELQLSLPFVLPTAVAFVGLMAFMVNLAVGAQTGRVLTGRAGLVTEIGEATADFAADGSGQVFVHGELWTAYADVPVKGGDAIEVVDVDGLAVKIRPRGTGTAHSGTDQTNAQRS